jgi:hypothetical protein
MSPSALLWAKLYSVNFGIRTKSIVFCFMGIGDNMYTIKNVQNIAAFASSQLFVV